MTTHDQLKQSQIEITITQISINKNTTTVNDCNVIANINIIHKQSKRAHNHKAIANVSQTQSEIKNINTANPHKLIHKLLCKSCMQPHAMITHQSNINIAIALQRTETSTNRNHKQSHTHTIKTQSQSHCNHKY
jgi:hypothetical protein